MQHLRARKEEHGVYRNKKKFVVAAATCEGKRKRREWKLARYAEGGSRTRAAWCLFRPLTISKIDMLAIKWTFVYKITVIDKPVIS